MFSNKQERSGFPLIGSTVSTPAVIPKFDAQIVANGSLDQISFSAGETSIYKIENSDIEIKEAGIYHIELRSAFAANGVGNRVGYCVFADAPTVQLGFQSIPGSADAVLLQTTSSSFVSNVKAGQKLQAFCGQTSGGNLNNLSSVDNATYFTRIILTRL